MKTMREDMAGSKPRGGDGGTEGGRKRERGTDKASFYPIKVVFM